MFVGTISFLVKVANWSRGGGGGGVGGLLLGILGRGGQAHRQGRVFACEFSTPGQARAVDCFCSLQM